jgi:arylsulfate sulfotransferase
MKERICPGICLSVSLFVLLCLLPGLALTGLTLTGCGTAKLQPLDPSQGGSMQPPPSSPPPTASQAGSVTINPQYIALGPGQTYQFTATVTGGGTVQWLVNGGAGGPFAGTITSSGKYTAPSPLPQSANVVVTAALSGSAQQNYATAVVSIIRPGVVTCPFQLNKNPQVAQYSVYLPAPGTVYVAFGTTPAYGLNTWQVPTPGTNGGTGGTVQLWVAGMLGDTLYHMQGKIVLNDGATYTDADQTCTTGLPPVAPNVQVTTNGTPPQPGIEMWNRLLGSKLNTTFQHQAFATDLKGNVIWAYGQTVPQGDLIQGIQLLPNGNLLMPISYLSSVTTAQPSAIYNEVREIDLDDNTIADLTMAQLNQKLAAAGNLRDGQGNLYHLGSFHHDVLPLPNGHFVLLATYYRTVNVNGYGNLRVIGDALVDVDQNFNPDWVWNTFDHVGPGQLDINRHPMNYSAKEPDWTHSNGLLYSEDGNLLLSMRHQNWIIKIEFGGGNGAGAPTGSGQILWRLGYQGDFSLVDDVDPSGPNDPANWFYAQHGMNFFSPATAGLFRIGMMDNGNDRVFATGPPATCPPLAPSTPTCYSTMPVLQIDESKMTATMVTHYIPTNAPDDYSFFGGNAELETNGDMEVDFCAAKYGSVVQEIDPSGKNVIWQGTTPGADNFHVYRMPSLYPGVQW